MKRVTGIWRDGRGPEGTGSTVWCPFDETTTYFAPGTNSFMINYRVEDLDAVLAGLLDEGVQVDEKIEDSGFGRVGWAIEPEGNRFGLRQPPPGR